MTRAVERATPAITRFLSAFERSFEAGGRIIYVGAGTSGRLGVLDASEAPPTFQVEPGRVVGIIAGGDKALRRSSEGLEDDPDGVLPELRRLRLTPRDAVIGITAGGTTPYALGALMHAKKLQPRCTTCLLTCARTSWPRHADHVITLPTGPEVLTGSTRMKAGSATKMTLNIISTTLMVRSGRVFGNLMVDLRATNDKLRDRAARVIALATRVDRAEAFDLLDRAGGRAKVAIAMRLLGCNPDAAAAALEHHGGRLADTLRSRPKRTKEIHDA